MDSHFKKLCSFFFLIYIYILLLYNCKYLIAMEMMVKQIEAEKRRACGGFP